jgi:DNA topoisomerase-1
MANFTNITKSEMQDFLGNLGFAEITIPNCNESVFAKRIDKNVIPLSMRIYTGIVSSESRGCGEDAIRVNVFAKTLKNELKKVVSCRRVNRVSGWRKNLESRIHEVFHKSPSQSCNCGNPMVLREGKFGEFLGCTNYPECKQTIKC